MLGENLHDFSIPKSNQDARMNSEELVIAPEKHPSKCVLMTLYARLAFTTQ